MNSLQTAFVGLIVIVAGCARPAPSEQQRMIEYEVRPESSEYVADEEVTLHVRVANRGETPIQIPDPEMRASTQPVNSLSGPPWPEGVRFTNNRVLGAEEDSIEGANSQLVTIEAGQEWTGVFAPNSFLAMREGGDYHLVSQLVFRNVKAQSQPTSFRIRPVRPDSIHLGLGTRPLEAGEGEGAFIDVGVLYTFAFQEIRPGIGEADLRAPIRRVAVDRGANDVAVPWRNAPFFNELLRWVVWREGQELKAISSTMTEPLSVLLPGDTSRLVRPPLKVTGQPVEVFALSSDERTLNLATLGGDPGQTATGAIAWSVPLPAHPGPITAVLGPAASGSERHIAFVVNRDGGVDIFHSRYRVGGRPESFNKVRIPKGEVLKESTIAIFVDESGAATVGAVTLSGLERRSCELAEATFEPDRETVAPRVTHLGTVPDTPVNTSVLYAERNGTPTRTVVIQLEQGQLFTMDGSTLTPVADPGVPTKPILLAPGKQTTYILYVEPNGGLHLEAL